MLRGRQTRLSHTHKPTRLLLSIPPRGTLVVGIATGSGANTHRWAPVGRRPRGELARGKEDWATGKDLGAAMSVVTQPHLVLARLVGSGRIRTDCLPTAASTTARRQRMSAPASRRRATNVWGGVGEARNHHGSPEAARGDGVGGEQPHAVPSLLRRCVQPAFAVFCRAHLTR